MWGIVSRLLRGPIAVFAGAVTVVFAMSPAAAEAYWQLREGASPGLSLRAFAYGPGSAIPLACDLNAGGADGVVLYDGGRWHARYRPSSGFTEVSFMYGWPGATPVCGDWNGDGLDGVGVYSAGRWFLRETPSPGPPDRVFDYGWSGALPVVGDWDGASGDGIGVQVGGRWMLRESATPGSAERFFDYGWAGPVPVAGDWDGAPGDGIGLYDRGQWILREAATAGPPDRIFSYGWSATTPIVGDWNADGVDGIGAIQSSSPIPPLATVRGVTVHVDIADEVHALLRAAGLAGFRLAGQGYRATEQQIEERRQNCGPTEYDIWLRPASQCNPPTAQPGRSMHEQGLAIDFTWNGALILSRDSPAFAWLAANANRYGLFNLPSEPWHWSVNGR